MLAHAARHFSWLFQTVSQQDPLTRNRSGGRNVRGSFSNLKFISVSNCDESGFIC